MDRLPAQARAWAEERAGRAIVEIVAGGGGITGTKWILRLADGELVVLRWADPQVWGEVGREHARREALACRLLGDAPVPTPRLIAGDLDGSQAGGPALLLSWRPGSLRYGRLDAEALRSLAAAAVAIHRTPVTTDRPPQVALRGPSAPVIPGWARWPEVWAAAFELRSAAPPASPYGLIHRDFHLGNLTWQGDQVSGVIDWAETSWGPGELDVAHLCSDLAMLHGGAGAAEFRAAYEQEGGSLDQEAARYWQVADIVGFLPDPEHILPGIVRYRPDLTADTVRRGLEDLLRLSVSM